MRTRKNSNELFRAIEKSDHIGIDELLQKNVSIDIKDQEGETALMLAVRLGHAEIARKLLLHGADPKLTNHHGQTALIMASEKGNMAIVRLLLESGAEVNAQDSRGRFPFAGWTALMFAARSGQAEAVKVLIANGADVNAKAGETALMKAAYWGHKEIIALLIAAGADVHTRNEDGETARILAEKMGQQVIGNLLQQEEVSTS